METRAYKCDVCGREKGPSNHWFCVQANGVPRQTRWRFVVEPWNSDLFHSGDGNVEHLCGQECLNKKLQAWVEAEAARWKAARP